MAAKQCHFVIYDLMVKWWSDIEYQMIDNQECCKGQVNVKGYIKISSLYKYNRAKYESL